MAKLTDYQKTVLDSAIINFIDNNRSGNIEMHTLAEEISKNSNIDNLIAQNFISAFHRINASSSIYDIRCVNNMVSYFGYKTKIVKIEKSRNKVYFYDNQSILIDGLYIDFDSKTLVNTNNIPLNEIFGREYIDRIMYYINSEWIFNYVNCNSIYETEDCFGDKEPKGFKEFLLNDANYIANNSFNNFCRAFNLFNKISKYGNIYLSLHKDFKDNIIDIMYKIGIDKIKKILCNSVKNGNFIINNYWCIVDFIKRANAIDFEIDTNRDFYYNDNNLKNLYKSKKNEILSNNLKKLNFLTEVTLEDFTIVIPQTLEDLQTEGRNQHNCVGSFYNESIINGDNLIYFLRDKINSDCSVITCRYSTYDKKTVEARRKNNSRLISNDEMIISEIDKIINDNL